MDVADADASQGMITHRHSDSRWKVWVCGGVMFLLMFGSAVAAVVHGHTSPAKPPAKPTSSTRSALVIMNVQEDYVREFVPGGDSVVPVINSMRDEYAFDEIVILKEWHCAAHISFASFHAARNKSLGEMLDLHYLPDGRVCDDTEDGAYIDAFGVNATQCGADADTIHVQQTLWADHCIKNTPGADLLPGLRVETTDVEVLSGYVCHVDNPESDDMEMMDKDRVDFAPPFDLWPALRSRSVTDVYFAGTALAFFVKPSKDAAANGFVTRVVRDAAPADEERLPELLRTFEENAVGVVASADIVVPRRQVRGDGMNVV